MPLPRGRRREGDAVTKMPDNLKRALLDALAQDLRPEDIERLDRERVALSDKLHAVYKEYLDAAKREGRPFDFTISVAVNALVDVMANAIAGIALTLSSVQGRKPDALGFGARIDPEDGVIGGTIALRFALYHREVPTYDEQRAVAGEPNPAGTLRLRQKFRRVDVAVCDLPFSAPL